MKKILLAFLFYLFSASFVFSQAIKDKGSFSLLVGPAFPVGKFSGSDLYDKSSGFAKNGESVSISFSKVIAKHWDISLSILGQRNPLNKTVLENKFSQLKLYDGFYSGSDPTNPPQTSYHIYHNWKFEKKAWQYAALLAGANWKHFIDGSKKVEFILKAMPGIVYAQSAELKGSSVSDTATAYILQSKSSSVGFIYSLGLGLNYNLNKSLFFSSALQYIGTNQITFKDIKAMLTTTSGTPNSANYKIQQSVTTGNAKQVISSINLSVGFGIRL